MKMNPVSTIKMRLGIEPDGRVQKFFTDRCAERMDKYVPKETGLLRQTISKTKNSITYEQPYAYSQYIGFTKGPVRNYTTPRNRSLLGQKNGKC